MEAVLLASRFLFAMAPSATEIAIRGALSRTHGPYKNHVSKVVDPLVSYFVGRGDSLVDVPLDVPSTAKADHERRWRARLLAAGILDAGDVEDFLLWMDSRSQNGRRAQPQRRNLFRLSGG